jgi:hypothetical protein
MMPLRASRMTLQAGSAMSAEDFFSTELFHAIRSKSFRDKKSFRAKTLARAADRGEPAK